MSIFAALGTLIAPATTIITNWQRARSEVSAAKHQARLKRIEAQKGDWKDEFLIIIWSAPLMCAFIPPLQEHAFKAFDYMTKLPDWYMGGWVAISLAVFGVDKILKFKG